MRARAIRDCPHGARSSRITPQRFRSCNRRVPRPPDSHRHRLVAGQTGSGNERRTSFNTRLARCAVWGTVCHRRFQGGADQRTALSEPFGLVMPERDAAALISTLAKQTGQSPADRLFTWSVPSKQISFSVRHRKGRGCPRARLCFAVALPTRPPLAAPGCRLSISGAPVRWPPTGPSDPASRRAPSQPEPLPGTAA